MNTKEHAHRIVTALSLEQLQIIESNLSVIKLIIIDEHVAKINDLLDNVDYTTLSNLGSYTAAYQQGIIDAIEIIKGDKE